jgi:hypothetical protein
MRRAYFVAQSPVARLYPWGTGPEGKRGVGEAAVAIIFLIVYFAVLALVAFVVFAGVLVVTGAGAWTVWYGLRHALGTARADGKSEVIGLLVTLLLLLLSSPVLFAAAIWLYCVTR